MIPPSVRRPGKYREGVIQIHVTRSCDKACFNCTQGSNYRGKPYHVSLDQFEIAVVSLKKYWGVVGIFGGNPAAHPQFETLCEIMRAHIPFEQRGLWCNNPLGKGAIMRQTFNPAVSNLNVHLDQKAYKEFKSDWPECGPVGLTNDSRHAPVYVAMKDVVPDESERWKLIANCDINKHWSAGMASFRGKMRAWFCEIAMGQSILHQDDPEYPDTGIPIELHQWNKYTINDWWWKNDMQTFAHQVRKHCHECSVPLRGYGELAMNADGLEQFSATHEKIAQPKKPDRRTELVVVREQLNEKGLKFTHYLQGALK